MSDLDLTSRRPLALASAILIASQLLSRVLGLLRDVVIAHQYGAGPAVDAYNIAFAIPDLVNHLAAGGFLSITLIPMLSRHLAAGDPAAADRLTSRVMTWTLALVTPLIAIAWCIPRELLPLFAPSAAPAVLDDAARMTRVLLPAQVCFVVGSVLMAAQFVRGRFLLPALAPLFYNGGTIVGGLAFGREWGMSAFAWGAAVGAFVGHLLVQGGAAWRYGIRARLDLRRDREVVRYAWLAAPLAVGLTATFANEFLYRRYGSFTGPGGISALTYAWRLMFAMVAVLAQGGSQAAYPFLARLAAEGRLDELNRLLNDTLRRVAAPVLCASALVFALAPEVVRVVFARGQFDAGAVAPTVDALRGFLPGSCAWAATMIASRGWFATGMTWKPVGIASVCALVAWPAYIVMTRAFGVTGVAASASIAGFLQVAAVYVLWNRRTRNDGAAAVYRALAHVTGVAVVGGVVAWGVRLALVGPIDPTTFVGALVVLAVAGGAGGIVLLALARATGVRWLR